IPAARSLPELHALPAEQLELHIEARSVAGEAAVGAHYAVAGDDDGDWVAADGAADGAGRGAEAAGEFGVGCELAAGYLQQQPPDSLAEIAAARGEGQLARLGALTGKIALQPGRCGPKNGQICLCRLRAEAG